MKLISLSITNVRRIRAAELDFDGKNLVEVRGRNGAGKSTVIDSILFLLQGTKAIPAGAVTVGEEKGIIVGKLGPYTVRRVITPDGKSTLTVESDTGKVPKPQEFLDQLAGRFLDPEWFVGLSSSEKRAVVLSYAGIDFAEIDRKIAEAEQARLLVGRELKALGTLPPEPEKVERVSVADLIAKRAEVLKVNEERTKQLATNRRRVQAVQDRLVDKLRDKEFSTFDEMDQFLALAISEFREGVAKITDWVDAEPPEPTDEIEAQLADTETINRKADTYAEWERKRDAITAKKAEYDAADAEVTRLREEKHGMVDGARMPVKGLTVTDTGLAYNGVGDENWSDSEALKIALNAAIAYSGELKAVYLKRGERLDAASLDKIRAYAEAKDIQIIVEVVDDSYAKEGEGIIYIDSGEVV